MAMNTIDDHQPIAEINIIPFVDIILVILIIFMVTAPFIVKTGFSLKLPQAGSAESLSGIKWTVSIHADGRVWFNGESFDIEKIKTQLQETPHRPEDIQALVSADKNVLHGKVISVINALKSLGLNKVAIATRKSKAPTP